MATYTQPNMSCGLYAVCYTYSQHIRMQWRRTHRQNGIQLLLRDRTFPIASQEPGNLRQLGMNAGVHRPATQGE